MIIKMLVENTAASDRFSYEHGLSLYIETSKHKILFDTGASGIFAENAEKMNVDLAQVDIAFISHGHYDHGGGLPTFLKLNSKASIYITEKALNNYATKTPDGKMVYIGLPKDLEINKRFIQVGDRLIIDDALQLFSNVKGSCLTPSGNASLYMEKEGMMVMDDFSHEQNLIIEDQGITLLVAGCAHKGIVNIIEHLKSLDVKKPDYVIGGFHLYSRSKNENEDAKIVKKIGSYLKNSGPKYFTCHCTGIESYNTLKKTMGEKIEYLTTGSVLMLNENGENIMKNLGVREKGRKMINKINTLYFSGTGTTRKVVLALGLSLAKRIKIVEPVNNIDFSLPEARKIPQNFDKDDLVIVGLPAYAGRVPNVLLKYLNSLKGNGAQAVAVVLYGNRDFEDALIELTDILLDTGFKVIAAGAFIGEHSFSEILAKGRPDESDMNKVEGFAESVYTKINRKNDFSELLVSGQKPYRNYYQPKDRFGNTFDFRVITPQTNKDLCIDCKHCAEVCSMGSILYSDISVMKGICIKCCACIKGCPVGAKYFDDENYLKHKHELEEIYAERREPETYCLFI